MTQAATTPAPRDRPARLPHHPVSADVVGGDRIEVRGLRVLGVHGVLPHERQAAQPFSVDLDIWLDVRPAAATDALEDTADYGALVDRAAGIVAGTSRQLLERLADDIAREVLAADRRLVQVAAAVRKLRPPLPLDVASVGVRAVRRRRRAFLGLGSNLGDRRAQLRQAVSALSAEGDVAGVSPLYETEPMGGPEGQPPYLNVVVALWTVAGPRQLLARCQALEQAARRERTVRFGPRTLDADVLLVGDDVVDDEDLLVPHPRMWERRFVLAPLADLAADLVTSHALAGAEGAVQCLGTL